MDGRINLFLKLPWLERVIRWRGFLFLIVLFNLASFYLFILSGIFGSPVGNRNIIIVFVWILWWVLLIAVFVPFGSRVWCAICPLPFFGDWLQRRALISVRKDKTVGFHNRLFGKNRRWPSRFSNLWLQNILFLALAIFIAILVTRPIVSAVVLGLFMLIAAFLALLFRLRTFCKYICPIGGSLSLYSMTSMVELRSVDKDVCGRCESKACIRGNERGWTCPWGVYMGRLDRNNDCGLCMECLRSCPNDNIALFARPFTSDIKVKGYDESWRAFIMLTLAFVYSVALLGPWGWIKDLANVSEKGNWGGFLVYASVVAFTALALFPAVYLGFVALSKWLAKAKDIPLKKLFIKYSYTLIPLGLLIMAAFSAPLIMVHGSYIISVISDPFGWGWNLFGTAEFPWKPLYPEYIPYVQIVLLLIGLHFSIKSGYRISRTLFEKRKQAMLSLAPLTVFLTGITIGFLRLYVG